VLCRDLPENSPQAEGSSARESWKKRSVASPEIGRDHMVGFKQRAGRGTQGQVTRRTEECRLQFYSKGRENALEEDCHSQGGGRQGQTSQRDWVTTGENSGLGKRE